LHLGITFCAADEYANPPHALALLRSCCERQSDCSPTENTKKFPPPHVSPQASGNGIVKAQIGTLVGAESGFAPATSHAGRCRIWAISRLGGSFGHVRSSPDSDMKADC